MLGEIAALTCALFWAIAARIFRVLGTSFSPLSLNLWKGLVALVLLVVAVQFTPPITHISQQAILFLIISGIIGIGLGDTFFFQAINRIGDSQTLLVAETLAPIFTAFLAIAWLAEWLSVIQWIGIALVIISVDIVIRTQRKQAANVFDFSGLGFAGLAALCQAIGAVMSRQVLITSEINAADASLIRLIGGLVIIILLILIRRKSWMPKTDNPVRIWSLFAVATFFGTFAALYLQMIAFSYTKAAIVQTLFATSVIISLGIARLAGDKVDRMTVLWSLLALVGVTLLFISDTYSAS